MTIGKSVVQGTVGFTVASLVVFGFWAAAGRMMYRSVGEGGFYAVCAVVFVALGVLLLHPLAREISFGRFALVYTGAFVAYAVSWCAAWFLVRGRTGEWVGSLAGAVAFTVVLGLAFRCWRRIPMMAVVLFVGHSLGYFGGSYAFDALREQSGLASKLAWGLCYGIGMGAGIGFAFHHCQPRIATNERE